MRGGRGVGKKKRRLGVPAETVPNKTEWAMHMASTVPEGGVFGSETTKQQHILNFEAEYPTRFPDANELLIARNDLYNTTYWIRKAKCRKAVANGDVPNEIWRILLCGSRAKKNDAKLSFDFWQEEKKKPPGFA